MVITDSQFLPEKGLVKADDHFTINGNLRDCALMGGIDHFLISAVINGYIKILIVDFILVK